MKWKNDIKLLSLNFVFVPFSHRFTTQKKEAEERNGKTLILEKT